MSRSERVSPALPALGALIALTAILTAPSAGRAALAALGGGSGTSGDLSSNRRLRQQQLICDPINPAAGSYSISYDPSVVSYSSGSLVAAPGYTITSGWIARNAGSASNPDPFLFDINGTGFNFPETGYIQVFFQANGQDYSPQTPGSEFVPIDSAGVAGDDTHMLTFDYLAGVPDDTVAKYTIFADAGGRFRSDESFSPADSLTDPDGNVIPYTDIAPATVSGSLIPEPATLGLLGAGALGLLARRRTRRVG